MFDQLIISRRIRQFVDLLLLCWIGLSEVYIFCSGSSVKKNHPLEISIFIYFNFFFVFVYTYPELTTCFVVVIVVFFLWLKGRSDVSFAIADGNRLSILWKFSSVYDVMPLFVDVKRRRWHLFIILSFIRVTKEMPSVPVPHSHHHHELK